MKICLVCSQGIRPGEISWQNADGRQAHGSIAICVIRLNEKFTKELTKIRAALKKLEGG